MESNQESALFSAIGNKSLFNHWKTLNPAQKQHLISQLGHIDIPTLHLQQQLISSSQTKHSSIAPFTNYSEQGNPKDLANGKDMIAQGLVGCLIVAGGQGTRLRMNGPKGICQVTKIRKKSLFQLIAEKTIAAGRQAGRILPLAIMTSPLNHKEIVAYFKQNGNFGLQEDQISFFKQEMLPLLDIEGNVFLVTEDKIAEGPDGNGGALHQFLKSGLWKEWYSKGVRYLNFVLIDNALADPFDAELVGFQKRQHSDVVIKCIKRDDPAENVGTIVVDNGKAAVVEYSELPEDERIALNKDGSLRHPLANLSLFSFNMDFVRTVAENTHPILHKAFKSAEFLDKTGRTVKSEEPMAWKFEKFIFDLLPAASRVDALVYPRESCFAPLKNFSGKDSFETVANAIEISDRKILSAITGIPCELSPLEIAADFYYPTPELYMKWHGKKPVRSGYID